MVREYEITYITKEYLLKEGWFVIAYNPPGSQGTFTIPNPLKDPSYRGQTGSESPDIVAIKKEVKNKKNKILIIESKPFYNQKDVDKMKRLFKNKERVKIFLTILEKQCNANGFEVDFNFKNEICFGKAHSGEKHLRDNIATFLIELKKEDWNPESFNAREDILQYFNIEVFNLFEK